MIDAEDRRRTLAASDVSRETLERLDRYAELLLRWQAVKNLIGPKTIPTLWTRHIADSLQLVRIEREALRWADFGSGAGFPGLVVACALAGREGARVDLVESNGRKAAFLREAARVLDVPAIVHDRRVEDVVPGLVDIEVVTARALAPLPDLLAMSALLLKTGSRGLFLKGQDVEVELTEASKSWTLEASVIPSVTDPGGRIVRIAAAAPRQ